MAARPRVDGGRKGCAMSTKPRGLSAVDLKLAMRQPSCPICRIRDEAEYRYLYFLLWENVNDGTTRMQIVNSLGFCPKHTWQMGRIETKNFGDAFGNSIIYENLVEIVRDRLTRYVHRTQAKQRSRWQGYLDRLLRRPQRLPFPAELQPQAICRVCQTGEQSERSHVHWLLQGLSVPEPDFRDWYTQSERLCFRHLRLALELADPETEAGAMFLARDATEYLDRLRVDLDEYGNKHAWDRRFEEMTESEKVSWLKAFIFFGGNERNENGHRPK